MPRRSGDWWLVTSHSQLLIPNPCFQTFSGGFAAPKGSQPRLAVLDSPFQGKGLAWILPPSYGRRCPEGAEVGWGKQDERSEGRSFQLRRLRQYPNTAQRLLSGHCPKRGKEGSARRFAWPLISPKILIKILAMDTPLCYNTNNAGMARLF